MIRHTHKWFRLPKDAIVEVVRKMEGTKAQSVYEIVELCSEPDCKAGRTRDSIIFGDVRPGHMINYEGLLVSTGKLRVIGKEIK